MFQILVLAGLKDINRPAERLSLYQSGALAATGKGGFWSFKAGSIVHTGSIMEHSCTIEPALDRTCVYL